MTDVGEIEESSSDGAKTPRIKYEIMIAQSPTTKIYKAEVMGIQNSCLVKEINLEMLNEQELKFLLYQMNLCKGISHPSLIKHHFSMIQECSLLIVSELQFIKLSQVVSKLFPDGIKEFSLVCSILKPVIDALEYLHSKDLIHRNIASSSIYLKLSGEVTVNYYCHLEKNKNQDKKSSVYRNICYLSPEILQEGDADYDKQVDIWSFGILAHELVSGSNPFFEDSYYESMKKIVNHDPPQFEECCKGLLKQSFMSLIQKCLSKDPSQRPSAKDISKYFDQNRGYYKKDLLKEKIVERIFQTCSLSQAGKCDVFLSQVEEQSSHPP
jgi:serine/threonine protein kinase